MGCPRSARLQGAVARGAKRIRVHVLTDGRDVPDGSSIKFVNVSPSLFSSFFLSSLILALLANVAPRSRLWAYIFQLCSLGCFRVLLLHCQVCGRECCLGCRVSCVAHSQVSPRTAPLPLAACCRSWRVC